MNSNGRRIQVLRQGTSLELLHQKAVTLEPLILPLKPRDNGPYLPMSQGYYSRDRVELQTGAD